MKLYLSGPMTGLPEHNFPAFRLAAEQLRAAGYEVVSPAEMDDGDTSRSYAYYLRRDIQAVLQCSGVALLAGWANSKGATLEAQIATTVDLIVAPVEVFLDYAVEVRPKPF